MRFLKKTTTVILVAVAGIVVGVMYGDKIKPLLQKIPIIGAWIK